MSWGLAGLIALWLCWRLLQATVGRLNGLLDLGMQYRGPLSHEANVMLAMIGCIIIFVLLAISAGELMRKGLF
jgi:hypothetical protein